MKWLLGALKPFHRIRPPESHGAVEAGARQSLTVGRESDVPDGGRVSFENGHLLMQQQVPQSNGAIGTA